MNNSAIQTVTPVKVRFVCGHVAAAVMNVFIFFTLQLGNS